jgi:hypothetical protein
MPGFSSFEHARTDPILRYPSLLWPLRLPGRRTTLAPDAGHRVATGADLPLRKIRKNIMTILVTGATGAVGSNILTHLAGKADVHALVRSKNSAKVPKGNRANNAAAVASCPFDPRPLVSDQRQEFGLLRNRPDASLLLRARWIA